MRVHLVSPDVGLQKRPLSAINEGLAPSKIRFREAASTYAFNFSLISRRLDLREKERRQFLGWFLAAYFSPPPDSFTFVSGIDKTCRSCISMKPKP
jgi:hypothetical protein